MRNTPPSFGNYFSCVLEQFISNWSSGTVQQFCSVTHLKNPFALHIHYKMNNCKVMNTFFWASQTITKWFFVLSEFDQFSPIKFGKPRAVSLNPFMPVSLKCVYSKPAYASVEQLLLEWMECQLGTQLLWYIHGVQPYCEEFWIIFLSWEYIGHLSLVCVEKNAYFSHVWCTQKVHWSISCTEPTTSQQEH